MSRKVVGNRNKPITIIVVGLLMLFIGLVEAVASIVIGCIAGTCENNCIPNSLSIILPIAITGFIFVIVGLTFIPIGIRKLVRMSKIDLPIDTFDLQPDMIIHTSTTTIITTGQPGHSNPYQPNQTTGDEQVIYPTFCFPQLAKSHMQPHVGEEDQHQEEV